MKITHNGYKINYFDTREEIDNYISSVLKEYSHLRPYLVSDCEITIKNKKARLIVYEYYTLYCEVFMVEEDNN